MAERVLAIEIVKGRGGRNVAGEGPAPRDAFRKSLPPKTSLVSIGAPGWR